MDKETFFQEYKGVAITAAALIIFGLIFLVNFMFSTKSLSLKTPAEPITIKAGETYRISWNYRNIGRLGLVLFKGDKPEWIVPNYPASNGFYDWTPFVYQDPGADYRIAMFEYPWRDGNQIVYTSYPVEIIGPKYSSCESYSIESEWPYLPSNYSNIHRVFITNGNWTGNLGGLVGADEKCAQEAESRGYAGNYIAFIGTDDVSAAERITSDGIFIEADSTDNLAEGTSCNRMIASSLKGFLDKTRLSGAVAKVELSEAFARKLSNVWYGRRTAQVDTECLPIPGTGATGAFSGTYTCQDWVNESQVVYSGEIPDEADLPRCYDASGKSIPANYFGASASQVSDSGEYGIGGDTCEASRSLICIEQ